MSFTELGVECHVRDDAGVGVFADQFSDGPEQCVLADRVSADEHVDRTTHFCGLAFRDFQDGRRCCASPIFQVFRKLVFEIRTEGRVAELIEHDVDRVLFVVGINAEFFEWHRSVAGGELGGIHRPL